MKMISLLLSLFLMIVFFIGYRAILFRFAASETKPFWLVSLPTPRATRGDVYIATSEGFSIENLGLIFVVLFLTDKLRGKLVIEAPVVRSIYTVILP